MRLTLPPHLEHARDQLQRIHDAGGSEAELVLQSLGLATKPPKRPKIHVVKRKGGLVIYSEDLAYAKALAKELAQCRDTTK